MRHHVQGNDEAVELLERSLTAAREGKISYALVLTYEDALPTCEISGVGGLDNLVARHLRIIAGKIEMDALPSVGRADFAVYDLALQPYSHDFASWLVQAEITRRRENAPAPLKVAFVRRLDGAAELSNVMLNKVMRPMLPLLGAVEGTHKRGRVNYFCDIRPIVDAFAMVALSRG